MYHSNLIRTTSIALAVAVTLPAQNSGIKARDLYYEETVRAQPITEATPKRAETQEVAHHLGLRYNLLLVDPSTRESKTVDSDGTFKEGNCFAIEFTPNRGGHLLVFNVGSSGVMEPLLPSAEMPDEATVAKANTIIRIPQEYCFRLDGRPGIETLVVAVTELKDDVDELHAGNIKQLGEHLQQWRLVSRDIVIEKLDQPKSSDERPHSVYVVRTSAQVAGRMVFEIKIHHE